jgi:hypothetical protein
MVPLVGMEREFNAHAKFIRGTARAVLTERNKRFPYMLGP